MPHQVSSDVIDWEGPYGISDAPSMGFTRGARYPSTIDVISTRTGKIVQFVFAKYENICGGAARHVSYRAVDGSFTLHVYDA